MPFDTLVDYQVLLDGRLTLSANPAFAEPQLHVLRFTVPEDFALSTARVRRPVLAFKVWPLEDCDLHLLLNSKDATRVSFKEGKAQGCRVVLDLSSVLSGAPDPISIRFSLQSGHCELADVIMWYKVNHV